MNPREAAEHLFAQAKDAKVRFPKIFDDSKIRQTCGATVMIFKNGEEFDFETALQSLIEKYGLEEAAAKPVAAKKATKKSSPEDAEEESGDKKSRKRKKGSENGDEDAEDGEEEKKRVKKTAVVTEERNRPVAESIKEMADIYFKNKDARKGGVFSKAAKAIRECDFYISSAKEAMSLPGIGKGIAGYIEEMLQTGSIQKLEELRAGIA